MKEPKLTAKFFADNRRRLLKRLPKDSVVVVAAHRLLQRNSDVVFRFRQDSNFFYLTGINEPDCLVIFCDTQELLVMPDDSEQKLLWEGQADKGLLKQVSGIKKVIPRSQSGREISKMLTKASYIYIPFVEAVEKLSFKPNPAHEEALQLVKNYRTKNLRDLRPHLARLRVIKQPEELECIEYAIAITKKGLRAAHQLIKAGKKEYELAAKIGQVFWEHNANEAFPIIVAAGGNACTIHYETAAGVLSSGEMVLFDVGAEYLNYAADISRTYTVGKVSVRYREVFDAVVTVQKLAMKLLKPGIGFLHYEKQVAEYMKNQLVKLGLLKPAAKLQEVRKFFPHGTSHYLGLDVHDAGDYTQPLQVGMVITVEPGIYIKEEGIGVRIEDDVLVTKTGIKNLTKSIYAGF